MGNTANAQTLKTQEASDQSDFALESEIIRRGNYTYPEAAEYLGLSEGYLRSFVKNEELIPIKFGKMVRFLKKDLDEFQESKRCIKKTN